MIVAGRLLQRGRAALLAGSGAAALLKDIENEEKLIAAGMDASQLHTLSEQLGGTGDSRYVSEKMWEY